MSHNVDKSDGHLSTLVAARRLALRESHLWHRLRRRSLALIIDLENPYRHIDVLAVIGATLAD